MKKRIIAVITFFMCLFALAPVGVAANAQTVIDFKAWGASQEPPTIQSPDQWYANTLFHLTYPTPPSHPITYVEYRVTTYTSGGGGSPTDSWKICYVSTSGAESSCFEPSNISGVTWAFSGKSSLGKIRVYHKRVGGYYPAYPAGTDSVIVHWQ